jgi:hypothetical protein
MRPRTDLVVQLRYWLNHEVVQPMDSIANPHLNNDLGTIIAFPGETFGLVFPDVALPP